MLVKFFHTAQETHDIIGNRKIAGSVVEFTSGLTLSAFCMIAVVVGITSTTLPLYLQILIGLSAYSATAMPAIIILSESITANIFNAIDAVLKDTNEIEKLKQQIFLRETFDEADLARVKGVVHCYAETLTKYPDKTAECLKKIITPDLKSEEKIRDIIKDVYPTVTDEKWKELLLCDLIDLNEHSAHATNAKLGITSRIKYTQNELREMIGKAVSDSILDVIKPSIEKELPIKSDIDFSNRELIKLIHSGTLTRILNKIQAAAQEKLDTKSDVSFSKSELNLMMHKELQANILDKARTLDSWQAFVDQPKSTSKEATKI